MRRFELSEGTSHKFWQIDLDGTSFTVTFGKIGTAGQTQTKSFDSADKARAEHDKVVKEKAKKGYAEVAGAPAAVPTPAPSAKAAPAPAVPPERPRVAAGVAWTDAALREVAPRHGWDVAAPRKPDGKAAFARIAEAFRQNAAAIEAGMAVNGADAELTAAARDAFSGARQAELDVEAQAAAYAMLAHKTRHADRSRAEDFMGYWAASAGAAFAMRALARAGARVALAKSGRTYEVAELAIWAAPPDENPVPWWRASEGDAWRALRKAVLFEAESERPALLALAAELRPTAGLETRAILACALERSDWGREDLDAAIAIPGRRGLAARVWPLALLAPSADDVARDFDRMAGSVWELARGIDPIRYDLVARFGPPLAPILLTLIAKAGTTGIDRMRALGEALALIVTPEVAEFFLAQLAAKELRAIAAEYLQAHPTISTVLLAGAAAGKGALADSARAVLKVVVAAHGDVVDEIKPSLGPAARALVDGLAAGSTTLTEVAPGELPGVLRELPWARKTKVAPPPSVPGLAVLPFDEGVAWRPGEREALLHAVRWLEERPADRDKNLAAIAAANDQSIDGKRSWELPQSRLFALLPAEDAIAGFNGAKLDHLGWSAGTDVVGLLVARHGIAVLPGLLRLAALDLGAALEALAHVRSAQVAPFMATAYTRLKKSRALASEWLVAFPEAAAIGLVPDAVGAPGAARVNAETALRFLAARGQRTLIEATAARHGAEALDAMKAVLDFDPLQVLPKKLPSLPAFFAPAALARPRLAGGGALPLSAVEALATMLAFTDPDNPYAGIAEIKAACDPRSLAEFAWDLFQAWLVAGAPSKESWALAALGLLGDDDSARKLTPLVRAWPGEAAHARAVLGLGVLARIGTDVALMHLHGIAQKLKFKALKDKAGEKIEQIAEARGLSAEELADRLVPDLGLDDDGTLALDFGPRRFTVVFDESLRPAVVDESGKRAGDLPKPKQTDDAEKAGAATETWKALKKDAKAVAQGQIVRLELAMCGQRRWNEEVFRRFLLDHPLLVHLVRRLVWGAHDARTDALVGSFRVAEDSSLADARDDAFSLPPDAPIGIIHRLEIDEALASRWGEVLADYEILQPFEQLARAVQAPPADLGARKTLDLASGMKVPTGKVLGLDVRGWRRGPPQDAGVVCWYEKRVTGGLVVSLDLDPGIFAGATAEAPEQTLGVVTLSRDGSSASWFGKDRGLTLGILSPIVYSELVRDLESLRS